MGTFEPEGDHDIKALERALELVRQSIAVRRHEVIAKTNIGSSIEPIDDADKQALVKKAEAIYRGRRARDQIFAGLSLFAEPAWDVLLDLFIASIQRQSISVSSAVIAANVPTTTGLRWVHLLETEGLIERVSDPFDGRRSYVELTRLGVLLMQRAIAEA